jgi:hypothetical protein
MWVHSEQTARQRMENKSQSHAGWSVFPHSDHDLRISITKYACMRCVICHKNPLYSFMTFMRQVYQLYQPKKMPPRRSKKSHCQWISAERALSCNTQNLLKIIYRAHFCWRPFFFYIYYVHLQLKVRYSGKISLVREICLLLDAKSVGLSHILKDA